MYPIFSKETELLSRELTLYDPQSTISFISGLHTVPHLKANTFRLEMLSHLAVACCKGHKKADYKTVEKWLNTYLGKSEVVSQEDPVEDVFITNIETPEGNFKIFEGLWTSNDYYLQVVLDVLLKKPKDELQNRLLRAAYALLNLSDNLAEKLNLRRWHIEESIDKDFINILSIPKIKYRSKFVTFSKKDLKNIGIEFEELATFLFQEEDRSKLLEESIGNSSLELRPLINFGDDIVFVLPSAVSPAIRRFVLTEVKKMNYLREFNNILAFLQFHQVENQALFDIKSESLPLSQQKPDKYSMPPLSSLLLKYDQNKYIHVILLHDRLDLLEKYGLTNYLKYPDKIRENFEIYIKTIAKNCTMTPDFCEGYTFIIIGGLGRGVSLELIELPENWYFSVITISDLLLLATDTAHPIKTFLKFIKQKEWVQKKGLEILNLSGDFNLFCYWRENNYKIIPDQLSLNAHSTLLLENNILLTFKQNIRSIADYHLIKTINNEYVQTRRLTHDSLFESQKVRPIFASLNHLNKGILSGAIETHRGPCWLTIKSDTNQKIVYEIWEGFLELLDLTLFEIEKDVNNIFKDPIEILLDFTDLQISEDHSTPKSSDPTDLILKIDYSIKKIEIKLPSNFMMLFSQIENTGEKIVIRTILNGLIELYKKLVINIDGIQVEEIIQKVLGDSGKRILHVFESYSDTDYLSKEYGEQISFIPNEDLTFTRLKLLNEYKFFKPDSVIETKQNCNIFFNELVGKIWQNIKEYLSYFDRISIIRRSISANESTLQDRKKWDQTAKAVIALHPHDDVCTIAQNRDSYRIQLALSARATVEMALCECPLSGGRIISQWEYEELLSKIMFLIDAATFSDAIYYDLIDPLVKIQKNCEYLIDASFFERVISPYVNNYFKQGFEKSAEDYSRLYEQDIPDKRIYSEEIFPTGFVEAFTEEFKIKTDNFLDGVAELTQYAIKKKNLIMETTIKSLRDRFINKINFSLEDFNNFINVWGLFYRESWETPPEGYNFKDIAPWRYKRRLSMALKPLLIFGKNDDDTIIYGAGSVEKTKSYFFGLIDNGNLPTNFFASKKMKKYIGFINDKKGNEFEKFVSDKLKSNGLVTRSGVKMTELRAPSQLGDIDVLAWIPNKLVLVIECKRLQLAGTVAEIGEICRRFKGDEKDELYKHLKRYEWIKNHLDYLRPIIGFVPETNNIDIRLVTNTHVPIMYIDSLPIEAKKIVPFDQLIESCKDIS